MTTMSDTVPLWPVQNLCPECAFDQFKVFSRREEGKVIVMRIECCACETSFDMRR